MAKYRLTKEKLNEYALLTVSSLLIILGNYFFKYPNNFVFGGVTGVSIILNRLFALSTASYNLIINVALLVIGVAVLGKDFVKRTVYV
ncbi:MAG TPA: YitT family protein, partial [Oscillospiraceae bacterium]|nr:YitT family protein [Oscillospiraceae bacterium]